MVSAFDIKVKIRNTFHQCHKSLAESVHCSLGALSRIAVAVNSNPQLNVNFIGQHIMQHVLFHVDRVNTSHELRMLTICLHNLRNFLSTDTLKLVENKVYQFIKEGKLKDDRWATLKILRFLCFPYWSQVKHFPNELKSNFHVSFKPRDRLL